MKHKTIVMTILFVAAVALGACAPAVSAAQPVPTPTVASLAAPNAAPANDSLSPSEVEALQLALQDEFKALATYEQVMADFGPARPFANIARAEEQHIAALTELFVSYDLGVPTNNWTEQVASYESLAAACQAGVDAEVENAALYDQLFGMVTQEDIIAVFEKLQAASLDKHLPAFERCVARY